MSGVTKAAAVLNPEVLLGSGSLIPATEEAGRAMAPGDMPPVVLADGTSPADHGFSPGDQAKIDAYNQHYLTEQQRIKDSNTAREQEVDLLQNLKGRDATILAGPAMPGTAKNSGGVL